MGVHVDFIDGKGVEGFLARRAIKIIRNPRKNLYTCLAVMLGLTVIGCVIEFPTFTFDTSDYNIRDTPISNRQRTLKAVSSGYNVYREIHPDKWAPRGPGPGRRLLSTGDGGGGNAKKNASPVPVSTPGLGRRLLQVDPLETYQTQKCEQRYGPYSSVTAGAFVLGGLVMYDNRGGSLDTTQDALSRRGLVALCRIIHKIMAMKDFQTYCLREEGLIEDPPLSGNYKCMPCIPPTSILTIPSSLSIPTSVTTLMQTTMTGMNNTEKIAFLDGAIARCGWNRTMMFPGQHNPEVDDLQELIPLGPWNETCAQGGDDWCDEELANQEPSCCRANCLHRSEYCSFSTLDEETGDPAKGLQNFCYNIHDKCPHLSGADYLKLESLFGSILPPDSESCATITQEMSDELRFAYSLLSKCDNLGASGTIAGVTDKYFLSTVPHPSGPFVAQNTSNVTGIALEMAFQFSPGFSLFSGIIGFLDDVHDLTVDELDGTDGFEVVFYQEIWENIFRLVMLVLDVLKAAASFIFVYFVMTYLTKSWWLAGMGMLLIFMSFPVTYFFFRGFFGYNTIGLLEIVTLFVVIGVGADDIFVFVDHWKASLLEVRDNSALVSKYMEVYGCKDHREVRFVWTYIHAVNAMFVTSLTTAVAFFGNTSAPILPIRTFGLWAGLLITCNYIMVCTFYAAVVAWHAEGKGCCRCWRWCCLPCNVTCCCLARKINFCKQCCVLDNGDDDEATNEGDGDEATGAGGQEKGETSDGTPAPAPGSDTKNMSPLTLFFHTKWADFITNNPKKIIIGVFLFFFSTFMVHAGRLKGPQEPPNLWPPESMPARFQKLLLEQLYTFAAPKVHIVWGLIPDDNGDKNQRHDYGTTAFDTEFDLRPGANQVAMYDLCMQIAGDESLVDKQLGYNCPIKRFRDYRLQNGQDFPVTTVDFEQLFRQFMINEQAGTMSYGPFPLGMLFFCDPATASPPTSYEEPLILCAARIEFTSLMDAVPKYEDSIAVWTKWEVALANFNANAPEGVNRAYQTSEIYLYMDFQGSLQEAAVTTTSVSISLAFVILAVFTENFLIAGISVASIGLISNSVLGFTVLNGWSLGIVESINLSILLGLSVDYVVHIAHAYAHSSASSKSERVRHALTENGQSILAGSVTTFGAGLFIGLAENAFFIKFGYYLMFTVCASCIVSLTFFVALLTQFGPMGSFCSARPVLNCICCCCPCYKKKKSHTVSSSPRGSDQPRLSTNPQKSVASLAVPSGHGYSGSTSDLNSRVSANESNDDVYVNGGSRMGSQSQQGSFNGAVEMSTPVM